MRVVIDCNIVVAAARIDGACRRTLIIAIRDHEIIISEPIIDEYRDVGARQKHRGYRALMLTLIDLLEVVSIPVEPAAIDFERQDPDDNVYLATALAGEAAALITGKLKHFPERSYRKIAILTPSEFLARV